MFNIFRRKQTPPHSGTMPPPVPAEALSGSQKKDVNKALEDVKDGKPSIDAVISMLNIGMKEFLPLLFTELEKSTVGILVSSPENLNSMLILQDSEQIPHLAIFTAPEYAKPLLAMFPQNRFVATVPMKSLCSAISGEIGLIINPKHETYSFAFDPQQFTAFRSAAGK